MPRARGANYKERKSTYVKHKKYAGVYCAMTPSPATGKDEEVFYISYYANGKRHFEKIGRKGEVLRFPGRKPITVSAATANTMRVDKQRGKELPNTERRQQEEAEKAASAGRWTFDKLWEAYKSDPDQGHINEKGEVDLIKRGKRGTYKANNKYTKHLKTVFGEKEPKDVTKWDIEKLRQGLAKSHAKETTSTIIGILTRIANYGMEKKGCPGIPFPIRFKRGTPLGREAKVKKAPTDEMIVEYVKTCKEWEDRQLGNFGLLLYYTGMRRSSAWHLTWNDVDLDRGEIVLPSTMTKSKKNIELVLNEDAVAMLRSHPRTARNPFVFVGENEDGRLTEYQVSKGMRKIREKAGIPAGYDPCHMWRINLATTMDAAGFSTSTIQQAGGWSSPVMPAHYTKVRKETLKKAVSVMSNVLRDAEAAEKAKKEKAETA